MAGDPEQERLARIRRDMYGDSEMQPLPDFDNVVVPPTQPYKCANCGQTHEAELVGQAPIGNMQIMLQYRAVVCPNTVIVPLDVVDGGPVVREAHDE